MLIQKNLNKMNLTIKDLIEFVKQNKIDENTPITNLNLEDFVEIIYDKVNLRLSTSKPIGECSRTGTPVYPSKVKGYAGYCPELDEDLYEFEFMPLKLINNN